jgi:hypothetical protein
VYVDVSIMVHADEKGHMGLAIKLGRKQIIATKNSTELR